jgi:predicted alpha/beta-fold hydrolase
MKFQPPALLGNPHVQSVLANLPHRRIWIERAARQLRAGSRDLIIDCGEGVRLLGHVSQPTGPANGRLVVMIHGWEGSADSAYLLSAAPILVEHGYTVVRLNLRDHGESHHLNEDMFHSCRLDEVVGAVGWIQRHWPELAVSLVGYSLGGNFALRVAAEAGKAGLQLDHAVAICPVLDPAQTMAALDEGWLGYRYYFLRRWRRSLLKKTQAFPDRYCFDQLQRFRSLQKMTDFFVMNYTDFPDLASYLNGYAITGDRLADLVVPSTMLLAADDPIIPVTGIKDMNIPDSLKVQYSPAGGHCGFITTLGSRSWLDDFLLRQLALSGKG